MNKTSFLSLVRQASNISDQEVEELEKLVVNFPYCQTAHLLIAKAAYDKGSMLSNQKLKKAAIYAANRQLLKKLIHTSDATVALQPVAEETVPEIPQKPEPLTAPAEIAPVPAAATIAAAQPPVPEILPDSAQTETVAESAYSEDLSLPTGKTAFPETAEATTVQPATPGVETQITDAVVEISGISPSAEEILTAPELSEPVPEEIQSAISPEAEMVTEPPATESPETVVPAPAAEIPAATGLTWEEKLAAFTHAATPEKETVPAESILTEITAPDLYEDEIIAREILDETALPEIPEPETDLEPERLPVIPEGEITGPEAIGYPETAFEPALTPETVETQVTPDLPETPIEDPVVFVAQPAETLNEVPDVHELLLENAPETLINLPVAEETEEPLHDTLASFDKYLFKPEKETEIPEPETDLKVVYAQNEIESIFAQDSIGYWMGSSRLGESLQLKNELTTTSPADFHPELILEYSKTHTLHKEIKPVTSNLSRQLEIIDEFLKMTPRLKSMAGNKIKPEAQEDLSIKSSKISKSLATESLANIMVKQGKLKKAIKIYEHLILKIPEKKPYFVAQIEKLKNME